MEGIVTVVKSLPADDKNVKSHSAIIKKLLFMKKGADERSQQH